jgi:hypothetical protein
MYRDIRNPRTGKLLFRYCPETGKVQIKDRSETLTIELERYQGLQEGRREALQAKG